MFNKQHNFVRFDAGVARQLSNLCQDKTLLIMRGASGSGKTTLTKAIEKYLEDFEVFHSTCSADSSTEFSHRLT